MRKCLTVGLTGQSGAGKTVVSEIFKEHGFGIINCDMVAREVTTSGSECNRELSEHFPACFDDKLTLDRRALGAIVFADREKLDILNSIIFKYIRQRISEHITELEDKHDSVILDAPTLFEAQADKLCDVIVAVVADEDIRLKRIIKRDGLDEKSVMQRFSSQHSTDFFRQNSTYVIYNNGTSQDTREQTEAVINHIKEDRFGTNTNKEKNSAETTG